MIQVIPAILEKDWDEIAHKIELAQHFSNSFHIDFIDGKFADNTTFMEATPFLKYSSSNFLEAHLMVDNPIQYLDGLAKAGFKRFIGQIEKMDDQAGFVARGQELGEVGLAIDGKTPFEDLKASFEDLDILLFMAIDAGFSGQEFNLKYLEKIKNVPEWFSNIEADGGINDQTITIAKNARANIFTSNSFIFNSQDPHASYLKLKDLASR